MRSYLDLGEKNNDLIGKERIVDSVHLDSDEWVCV